MSEEKKFIEAAAKIKPHQWKAMTENLTIAKEFIDNAVGGGLQVMVTSITDSISLKVQELISPIRNEVDTAIAKAIAPIMPMLSTITNAIGSFLGTIMSWDWWARQGEALGQEYFDPNSSINISRRRLINNYPDWLRQNPGGSLADYLKFMTRDWQAGGADTYNPYDRSPSGRVIF